MLEVPEGFAYQVAANMDQAEAEGWINSKTVGATVLVTVGCLIANAEATLGPQSNEWIRALRRCIYML